MERRLTVTTFPRAERVIEHTLIPLKDGTTLVRIWLPETPGGTRFPQSWSICHIASARYL